MRNHSTTSAAAFALAIALEAVALIGDNVASNARAEEKPAYIENTKLIWLECIESENVDHHTQYFGYFVFDKAHNKLHDYDRFDHTVRDLHADVSEDTISWSTASDMTTDIQAEHTEEHLQIDRRTLKIQVKVTIRLTALVSNANAGDATRNYIGVCKKTPPQSIRDRQI